MNKLGLGPAFRCLWAYLCTALDVSVVRAAPRGSSRVSPAPVCTHRQARHGVSPWHPRQVVYYNTISWTSTALWNTAWESHCWNTASVIDKLQVMLEIHWCVFLRTTEDMSYFLLSVCWAYICWIYSCLDNTKITNHHFQMSRIQLMNLNGYGENFRNKYKTLTAVGRFYILFIVTFFTFRAVHAVCFSRKCLHSLSNAAKHI